MISIKELQYVDLWANKIPMPGYEYSIAVLNEIKKCYEVYKARYKDKEYSMIFSNSEEIEFEIFAKNLCHMLGIDYNNIMGDYFKDYRLNVFKTASLNISSFELLELILENMQKVAELDNDIQNKAKVINYYKSAIKCEIFNKLSDFGKFNFAAINYHGDNENVDYNNQKLLFVASNETIAPYFMMCIKEDNREALGKYVVVSLFAPGNPIRYFENQEVIIPTQILISNNDNLTKLVATSEEKIGLLTLYASVITKYNIPNKLNIFGDYESTLNALSKAKVLTR